MTYRGAALFKQEIAKPAKFIKRTAATERSVWPLSCVRIESRTEAGGLLRRTVGTACRHSGRVAKPRRLLCETIILS
jgi:hypothetical protein